MTLPKSAIPKNPLIEKYRHRFEGPGAGQPLSFEEAAEIFEAYRKLDQRLARIARISDNFQSKLQDLKKALEHSSRTDYLTGLPNRRDICERLSAEQNRCFRNGKIFSLIMADLDLFKRINDSHGHAAGDRFLAATAEIFKANLRKEDCCARWGGEEFLILLPETDAASAFEVAEKLRRLMAGFTLDFNGERIGTTLSVGVSVYHRDEPHVQPCLTRVDEALYQAKSGGRNCSILCTED